MAPFKFKSQNHFVSSSDGTTLQVYELTEPPSHPSSIQKTHLKEVANIQDGLSFPEGGGKIKGQEALTRLAQHLAQLRLLVNPSGYSLQDVTQLHMYTDFQIDYLRLNDLFSWSHHGIKTTTLKSPEGWSSRSEMNHHAPEGEMTRHMMIRTDIYEAKEEEMRETKMATEDQRRILKKMESEFEIQRKEKDEEAEKLKEPLVANNGENSYEAVAIRCFEQDMLLRKKEIEIEKLQNEQAVWMKALRAAGAIKDHYYKT
ncbi:hypothetical protein LINPERPRIM_LOCUS39744 [Linum perenne]